MTEPQSRHHVIAVKCVIRKRHTYSVTQKKFAVINAIMTIFRSNAMVRTYILRNAFVIVELLIIPVHTERAIN